MTIGQRIRMKREELGMTQDELTQRIGYKSRSSINKIELDGRNLTQQKIKLIADALQTTPGYIMGWDDEIAENKRKLRELLIECYGEDVYRIICCYLLLDAEDRGYVNGVIDTKLEQEKYRQEEYGSA